MESCSVEPAWQKLFELINDVCLQEDTDSMLSEVIRHLDEVVPADHGVVLNEVRDGLPYCLRWPAYADPLISAFNHYYNRCCPVNYNAKQHTLGPVDWHRFKETEYDNDFNRPLDLGHSIGIGFPDLYNNKVIVTSIHRFRSDSAFSESDVHTLYLIRPLLSRLFSLARDSEVFNREHFHPSELYPKTMPLSPREAEVVQFLCRRLSMREIAARLSISPRTVERHTQHIYQKLGVGCRKELISRCLQSYRS